MLAITLLVSALLTYFTVKYSNRLDQILPSGSSLSYYGKEQIFGYFWSFVLLDLPVFASVFFGSPAISSEIENRTAFQIFPLPIGRTKLLLSKYLAAVAVTSICIFVYEAFQAAVFVYVFNSLIPAFYTDLLILAVFIFTITSFTFLISGIFNRNTYAYITVFLIYFLVFTAYEIIDEFLYRTTPYYLLNVAAGILERVYINISPNPFSPTSALS
ncbi:MAG: ABC transporter permease subunit, partial [Methanomassiliicoccales archaeon]